MGSPVIGTVSTLRSVVGGVLACASDAGLVRLADGLNALLKSDALEWKRVDAALRPLERELAAAVVAAHVRIIPKITHALEDGRAPGEAAEGARAELERGLEAVGRRLFPGVLRQGWTTARRQIREAAAEKRLKEPARPPVGVDFDLEWPEIADFIRRRPRAYAIETSRSSIDAFRSVLQEGAEGEGLSIPDLVRQIVQLRLPEVARWRALLIARTEVVSAANRAAHASYEASGVVERKGWLYTRDARTRDSHRYSGVVDLDEPFELPSGARLMHPGDTSLGAPLNEIVRCRCAIRPHVSGLPGLAWFVGGVEKWDGAEHPRDDRGRFSAGAGGGGKSDEPLLSGPVGRAPS